MMPRKCKSQRIRNGLEVNIDPIQHHPQIQNQIKIDEIESQSAILIVMLKSLA